MTRILTKEITLPGAEEMYGRLLAVNKEEELRRIFYPKLLQLAGQEMFAATVMALVHFALYYAFREGMSKEIFDIASNQIPEFIDAICPDEEVGTEAKRLSEQVKKTSKSLSDQRIV